MLTEEWDGSVPTHYQFTHVHIFDAGESAEMRESWMEKQLRNAGLTRTELFCRQTPAGYDFGFKEFAHFAAFRLNAYGDPPTRRGHTCTQRFDGPPNPCWLKSAEACLQSLGIDYQYQVSGNSVSFAFDRFSEHAALRLLIDSGEIDRLTDALHRSRSFLDRIARFEQESPSPAP